MVYYVYERKPYTIEVKETDTFDYSCWQNCRKEFKVCELRKIKYKGIYHLYNYAFQTDCEIKIPLKGKHLTTQSVVQELSEITCPKCLKTLEKNKYD